jgi:hypothetical protein
MTRTPFLKTCKITINSDFLAKQPDYLYLRIFDITERWERMGRRDSLVGSILFGKFCAVLDSHLAPYP